MESVQSAPVVLFGFARPETTARVLERIVSAAPEVLFLVQDAPRPGRPDEARRCDEVSRLFDQVTGIRTLHRIRTSSNMGLRERLLTGLDEVFQTVDRAIILEDDTLPSPSFFPFATELLERYAGDSEVGSVSGNSFLFGREASADSYFFSADVRIWGWATWARTWRDFRRNPVSTTWASEEVRAIVARLESPWRRRALQQMAASLDTLDTWDVQFVLHCIARGWVQAMPRENLVTNIGFGAGSTHTAFESYLDELPGGDLEFPLRHPETSSLTKGAGVVEYQALRTRLWRYPLRHPFDVAGRLLRYLRSKLRRG